MTPTPTPTDHDDAKAPHGAFFISRVNKFGAGAIPAHGLDIDFSELPPLFADDLEIPVALRALAEALTGADLQTAEPMPEPLRRRAEEIRAGMWPELSIHLAAAIAIVKDCHLHQHRPSHSRREWLKEHSPGLLSYLDTMADGGPAAWRTVQDRWMIQAQAMDLAGVEVSARVPRYEHMLRALKDMAAIGSIAVRKAEEDQRAAWELARKQAAAAAGLRPDQEEDQGGGAEGGSGGGQKAKPGQPVEAEEAAEDVILTPAEIAAMGWGKPPAEPPKDAKEDKNDFTPPGGLKP